MKLRAFSEKGQELLNKLLALPVHHTCRRTVDTCTEGAIHEMIRDFEEMSNTGSISSYLKHEIQFLKNITAVYQDGRSCPGPEMMEELKKLTDGRWKFSRSIIIAGIRDYIISLEYMDVCAINEWTPPEGFLDDVNVRRKYR